MARGAKGIPTARAGRKQLSGKVVIVTGASRGLGRLIALAVAAEGARVAVVARSTGPPEQPGTIEHTAAEIGTLGGSALALACDVTREPDTHALAERVRQTLGRIDVLVNNAAVYPKRRFLDMDLAFWRRMLDINLTGQFLCCRAVVPHMIERGGGASIINISSSTAIRYTIPHQLAYATSKAAVNRFSTALGEEMREYNIAVNALDPGGIKTEGLIEYTLEGGKLKAEERGYQFAPALPSVIGPAVVFLAQQTARTFTGHIVRRIDYGRTWGEGLPEPVD